MRRNVSMASMLFICTAAAFGADELLLIQKVLDLSHFPILDVEMASHENREHVSKVRFKLDGVGELTPFANKEEIKERLIYCSFKSSKEGDPKLVELIGGGADTEFQALTFSGRIWGEVTFNALCVEMGWAKPKVRELDWGVFQNDQFDKLKETVQKVPELIATLKSKTSNLEHRRDALSKLRSVRLHARDAIPIIRELIDGGVLVEEGLSTLGFIASDDPEQVKFLVPYLKNFPQSVLQSLMQMGPVARPAENEIVRYIKETPDYLLTLDWALEALNQFGDLSDDTVNALDKIRAENRRDSVTRNSIYFFMHTYRSNRKLK